jgi:hypothetical protein
MKSRSAITSLTLLFALAPPAHAGDESTVQKRMDGIAISSTFPNMSMTGNYSDGMKFTEVYHPDGTITYSDEASQDNGRWYVRGALFCTFYDVANGACFSVRKSGANCFEYFIEEEEDGSPSADHGAWNSIGWDNTKPSTCDRDPKIS